MTVAVIALPAQAQDKVRWKMQSAFGAQLPHIGTSAVRFSKNIERLSRRQVRDQVLRAGCADPAAGVLRRGVEGLDRIVLDDAGLPHRQVSGARLLHHGAVRAADRRVPRLEVVRRRQQAARRDLRQARPVRDRLVSPSRRRPRAGSATRSSRWPSSRA